MKSDAVCQLNADSMKMVEAAADYVVKFRQTTINVMHQSLLTD